ncbi:nucleotide-binding protein [[Kitasatospora] papulosa]|uniref:nucleotide-binding protein n=1 Tax=[Kitasatospora] papulosa TaxID=1464011 RepID=UPI0036822C1F
MTESPRTALPSPDIPAGERLEGFSARATDTPHQARGPQILVPETFRPAEPYQVHVAVNQRGGAGRVTIAVELAAAWASAGLRVQLIDAGHQEATIAPVDEEAGGRLPCDVTLINVAPSLGLVIVAALTAGNEALVPGEVRGLDMKAMASPDRTIRGVPRITNLKPQEGAVLLTAGDKGDFARQRATKVPGDYPSAVVVPVRRKVRAAEAPIAEEPVHLCARKSTTAADHEQAASILMRTPGVAA